MATSLKSFSQFLKRCTTAASSSVTTIFILPMRSSEHDSNRLNNDIILLGFNWIKSVHEQGQQVCKLTTTSHQVDTPILTGLDQLLGFCQFNLLEINVFSPGSRLPKVDADPRATVLRYLDNKGSDGLDIPPPSGASPGRRHSRQQVKAVDREERNACWRSNVYWSSYE